MNDSDTLVASILDRSHNMDQSRLELKARGLARAHDEYVKAWQQRMKAALRQSPVSGLYVR